VLVSVQWQPLGPLSADIPLVFRLGLFKGERRLRYAYEMRNAM